MCGVINDPIPGASPIMKLPDEMMLEILTRLPGKQLARCKCVCKSWQLIVKSRTFLEAYRDRKLGLIVYWTEMIDPEMVKDSNKNRCFRFSHFGLQRLKEPKEKFSCLYELAIKRDLETTDVVNGLMCTFEYPQCLNLYNVCSGQMMRIPDANLPECDYGVLCTSWFFLGYDPSTRVYKLLRLMYYKSVIGMQVDQPFGAEVMTLKPSHSVSTWRKLDINLSGVLDMPEWCFSYLHMLGKSLPGEILCWVFSPSSLVTFDLVEEKFNFIKLPDIVMDVLKDVMQAPKHAIFAKSMGHLAVWILPQADSCSSAEYFTLFVLEDDEGEIWSKHCVQIPEELDAAKRLIVSRGNLPTGEMLLMYGQANNDHCRPVYSYDHIKNKFDRFLFGELPEQPIYFADENSRNLIFFPNSSAVISCLHDNNNVHLPLDDVLSGEAD